MWHSLKWLFGPMIPQSRGMWAVCLGTVLFVTAAIYSINSAIDAGVERQRQSLNKEAFDKGRHDREDGRTFQQNPYKDDHYRNLWRQGWKSANEVKE